jgi:hypothetical protein
VARMGETRNAKQFWLERLKGKRRLRRPRRRRKDNIKIDLWETELEGLGCFHLTQNRDRWRALVNTFVFHKSRGIS